MPLRSGRRHKPVELIGDGAVAGGARPVRASKLWPSTAPLPDNQGAELSPCGTPSRSPHLVPGRNLCYGHRHGRQLTSSLFSCQRPRRSHHVCPFLDRAGHCRHRRQPRHRGGDRDRPRPRWSQRRRLVPARARPRRPPRAIPVEADLSDPTAPLRIFEQVEAGLGPVAILVNNASGWKQDTFSGQQLDAIGRPNQPVTAATVDAQLLVGARGGALTIAQLAARAQRRGADWGRIISLTSGGPGGFPGEVSYGAAKAALENYTLSAASELAPLGITANVVYPPVTDTGWVTDAVRQVVAENADLHHVAEPDDVAEVIGWLCTDATRLVTGNVLHLR